MKPSRVLSATFALAFAGSVAGAAQQSPPAKPSKPAAEEKESGKVVWEVESTENGLGRDLVYTPDGSVVEIEEEVPSAQLRAPAGSPSS
jgi:hypothetical protein